MQNFLILLCALSLLACERLTNRLDQVALDCGDDARTFGGSRFILPESESTLDPAGWQAVASTGAGYKALTRTSRGCLVINDPSTQLVYLRHDSGQVGASLEAATIEGDELKKVRTSTSPERLQSQVLNLSCGPEPSRDFGVGFGLTQSPAPQLHHYRIQFQVLQKDSALVLTEGTIEAPGAALALPRVLADGSYTIRYQLSDVFEDLFAGIAPKTLSCPLEIDTTPPTMKGFKETLTSEVFKGQNYFEVVPGQALNLSVGGEKNPADIYICTAVPGSDACQNTEDFIRLTPPFLAPEDGQVQLKAFAADAAGNQSPIVTLPTLAIVHRPVMESVRTHLKNAGLEAERGNPIDADLSWLRAYQTYSSLKLDLEREPLAGPLGLTYSDITRSQRLRAVFKDHSLLIKKMAWIEGRSPTEDSYASLDGKGELFVRSIKGTLTAQESGVADIVAHPRFGLIILYRNGTYQLGLGQDRVKLPDAIVSSPFAFTLSLSPDAKEMLVAGPSEAALFSIDRSLQLLWRQSIDLTVTGAPPASQERSDRTVTSIGPELVVIAGNRAMASLNRRSGQFIARQQWDDRCNLSLLVPAAAYGWFVSLQTDPQARGDEKFHCNLFNWDGTKDWQEILPEAVHRPDDIVNEPGDFRFEEIHTMVYAPEREWLIFGRKDLDARFAILDLKAQRIYFVNPDKGSSLSESSLSAMALSPDGHLLAVSQSVENQTRLFDLKRIDSLDGYFFRDAVIASFSEDKPTSTTASEPDIISLLIAPRQGWLLSADRQLELRIHAYANKLQTAYPTTVAMDFNSLARSTFVIQQADRIEQRNRFGDLTAYSLPPFSPVALFSTPSAEVFAFDADGQLWQADPAGAAWQARFQSDLLLSSTKLLNEPNVLVSPSGQKLAVIGQSEGKWRVKIYTREGQENWSETALIKLEDTANGESGDSKLKRIAWSPLETHLSLVTQRPKPVGEGRGSLLSSSLWTVTGQKVVTTPLGSNEGMPRFYAPFSSDGKFWLSYSKNVWQIYDLERGAFESEAVGLGGETFAFASFAGSRSDRLWLGVVSSGSSQTLLEIDHTGNQEQVLGTAPEVRLAFERDGNPWVYDASGNLYAKKLGSAGFELVVSAEQGNNEIALGINQKEGFMLVHPGGNESLVSVVYLTEDQRLFQAMCTWIEPLLVAGSSLEIEEARSSCRTVLPQLPR